MHRSAGALISHSIRQRMAITTSSRTAGSAALISRPLQASKSPEYRRTSWRRFLSINSGGAPPPKPPPPPPSRAPPPTGRPGGAAPPPPPPPPPGIDKILPPGTSVIEVDEKNFMAIIGHSPVPVILDCYANWCDPCKKLTPILESLVTKYKGKVLLAKLDVDVYQEIAMQLNVRNLPSVFGIFQGKMVDRFVGMPNETQLAGFMEKLLAISPAPPAETEPEAVEGPEAELAEADLLMKEAGKAKEAGAIYKKVYEDLSKEKEGSPHLQARSLAGLAKCALFSGHSSEAEQIVGLLQKQHANEIKTVPEVSKMLSFVETALKVPRDDEGGSVDNTISKLRETIKTDPNDLQTRHTLALKLFGLERFEEAINEALEILKRDKTWNEGAARQLLLKIFETLGPNDGLAKKGRQRMTNYLFL